jgi:hypothetical protein
MSADMRTAERFGREGEKTGRETLSLQYHRPGSGRWEEIERWTIYGFLN